MQIVLIFEEKQLPYADSKREVIKKRNKKRVLINI